LSDPGDGSGTFEAVTSDKHLSFYDDGNLICQGSLSAMAGSTDTITSAIFDASDLTINSDCWVDLPITMTYEISNDTLLLNYPCIEGCIERYLRED
jgi:hypothetical protein